MKKTNPKTLEEIIRVDHAGERGAIKIYEGQLLALKTIKQDENLKDIVEDMKEHEKEHLEYFEKEIQKRKIKPTYMLPLWDVMGVALGFGTVLLGKKATMLCTASVEEVIENHYDKQLKQCKALLLFFQAILFQNLERHPSHPIMEAYMLVLFFFFVFLFQSILNVLFHALSYLQLYLLSFHLVL
jgi:demethoxyubiquinone hydroxylase (CLK1/Coq7/Cat5 family)